MPTTKSKPIQISRRAFALYLALIVVTCFGAAQAGIALGRKDAWSEGYKSGFNVGMSLLTQGGSPCQRT